MPIYEILAKVGPIEIKRKLEVGQVVVRADDGLGFSDSMFRWQAKVVSGSKIETLTTIPDYPGRTGFTGEPITTPGEANGQDINGYGPKDFLRFEPEKVSLRQRISNFLDEFRWQYFESAGHD